MGPEARLESRIAKAVQKLEGLYLKQTGVPGIPDRLVIIPTYHVRIPQTMGGTETVPYEVEIVPRYFFLELKAARGRLSELQKAAIERLRDLGCDARVLIGSVDVIAFIQELELMY